MKYRVKYLRYFIQKARKFYNDPMKYDIIVDANKNIENPEDLKLVK